MSGRLREIAIARVNLRRAHGAVGKSSLNPRANSLVIAGPGFTLERNRETVVTEFGAVEETKQWTVIARDREVRKVVSI